jgi:hypothetical protein
MKHDKGPPISPTEDLVATAVKKFDEENAVVEQALKDLFNQYRRNDNHSHVLLKVVALNRLYSTQILAVHDVARHIYQQAQDIDSSLAIGSCKIGSPEIVDRIAKVTISATGRQRANYSFATKYCSWHRPDSYPIWDDRVRRYLQSLRRTPFATFLRPKGNLWDHYPEFVKLMSDFRDFYRLGQFTFKDIDKFLWSAGEEPSAIAATQD